MYYSHFRRLNENRVVTEQASVSGANRTAESVAASETVRNTLGNTSHKHIVIGDTITSLDVAQPFQKNGAVRTNHSTGPDKVAVNNETKTKPETDKHGRPEPAQTTHGGDGIPLQQPHLGTKNKTFVIITSKIASFCISTRHLRFTR